MKNSKRILSVVIKRMLDESPDTSWLGEYSNHATSEFSIDRAHSLDCLINFGEANGGTLCVLCDQSQDVHHNFTLACPTGEVDQTWEENQSFELPECDCGESGDMGRNEHRYFNPSFNYVDKNGKATDTPENVRKYPRQDYERMESLNRGNWCFIGIRAEAEIAVPSVPITIQGKTGEHFQRTFTCQTITSGGLWGIESDLDASYLESVEQDELADLKARLLALGFSKRAIATAFKTVEHKEA